MDNTTQRRTKFVELANKRVSNALKAISLIGNLSNQSAYAYTKEDANKIAKALIAEVEAIRRKFDGKGNDDNTFRIE
jgi:hypothetical protein